MAAESPYKEKFVSEPSKLSAAKVKEQFAAALKSFKELPDAKRAVDHLRDLDTVCTAILEDVSRQMKDRVEHERASGFRYGGNVMTFHVLLSGKIAELSNVLYRDLIGRHLEQYYGVYIPSDDGPWNECRRWSNNGTPASFRAICVKIPVESFLS